MSERGLVRVNRALISVSDKTGIGEFASALREMGVELLSTGGTYRMLRELGLETKALEAGGLDRKITITRLPENLDCFDIELKQDIALNAEGDTPIWVRVATEDGHLAWSSPIYVLREVTA